MAIVAVAVAGVGLFGTGVRGIAALDERLAAETPKPAVRDVKRELGGRGDCPQHERDQSLERRQL